MPGEGGNRYPLHHDSRSPRLRPGRILVTVAPVLRDPPHPQLGIPCTSSWRTPPATSAPMPPSGAMLVCRLRFFGSLLGWAHTSRQPEANTGLPVHNSRHTAAPGQHFGPCTTVPYLPCMHSHVGINNRNWPRMDPSSSGNHGTQVRSLLGASPRLTVHCPQAPPARPLWFHPPRQRIRPPRRPQAMPIRPPVCHIPPGVRPLVFDDPTSAIVVPHGPRRSLTHRCHLLVVWNWSTIHPWQHPWFHIWGVPR